MADRACGWFPDGVRGRWSVAARTARKRSRTWMAVRACGDQAWPAGRRRGRCGAGTRRSRAPARSRRSCSCRMAATGAISSCRPWTSRVGGQPGGRGGPVTARRSGRGPGWGSRRPASRAGRPPCSAPSVGRRRGRTDAPSTVVGGVPVGSRVVGPADLLLAGVVVVGGQVGLPVQRDDPADARVGAGQLGQGQAGSWWV